MAGITNPYIAGAAIHSRDSFLGRRDILQWIEQELRNPGTNALVLFGQRRIGKTSLLLQIQRILPEADFVVTYFDLQDQAMHSLGKVLADLSEAILDQANLKIELPDRIEYDETGQIFRTKFLPAIYKKVPEPKRFVILLDEFDVLDVAAEERLSNSAAAKSLLPFLRKLIADKTRLVFIFGAGRRPQDLSINFNQTFKTGLSQEVWVLDKESAIALIRRAEDNETLIFTNQAIERILALTNGHPYLTQLTCQRIWERAHRVKPDATPTIDNGDVDASLPDVLQAGSQALLWLWEGLTPAERIYAAALAEVSSVGKPITEHKVIQILSQHASRLRTREVELAPRELTKRQILQEVNGGYRFAVELFRIWVKQFKSLQEVKDELDRTDIPALKIYELGVIYYRDKNWKDAIQSFKDALKRNPKLFRAQLMIGETFYEMKRYDNAVIELEKAYILDKDDSYLSLARALIAQTRENEKKGNIQAAISSSQRATQVSPTDKEAKLLSYSLQSGVKEEQAKGLLENNKWLDAAEIFKDLLKQDTTKDPVKSQQWQNYVDQCYLAMTTDLEKKGVKLMEAKNWGEAEKIFKELSTQKFIVDPVKKKEWEYNLFTCTFNLEIQTLAPLKEEHLRLEPRDIVASSYKPSILIVDTENEWQRRLSEMLKFEFHVVTAYNYAEAMERLSNDSLTFHVVVTEISLDEKDSQNQDGFLLADQVNRLGGNIQTIILTRYATAMNTRKAFKDKKVFNLLEKTSEYNQPLSDSYLLENIRTAAEIAERNVFLIMPFEKTFSDFYGIISDIVNEMGLVCRRLDDVFRPNVVMGSVLDEINHSRIAISDLSNRNPNVYFETGIAHSRRKAVILLTRNQDDISSNLRSFQFLTYENSLKGASELRIKLSKAIEDARANNFPTLERIDTPELDFCFVLTKEDNDSQDTFQQVIKPTLAEISLPYVQLKDVFGTRNIIEEIRVKLHSSRLVIADVFGNDADILYWAGYAYGLGKNIIYLARREEDVPFDLRVASSIIYSKDKQNEILNAKENISDVIKGILKEPQLKASITKNIAPIRVFINYATEDKSLVRKLYSELKKIPWIDLWMDEERLLPGQDLELEISKALTEADAVLLCLSSKSLKKIGYVQAEIRKAEEQQKLRPPGTIYLIPILLENIEVPINSLQRYQWVNISQPGKLDLVIKALETLRKE